MTQRRPLVSGIIIFFNGENFLQDAVESVLAQTYTNWELFLVDDGSNDGSSSIARRYAQTHSPKVSYLEHPGHENRGKNAARNLGLRHARGEYVALLDHDDIWLPSKLEDQVALLESRPDVGMVYGRTKYWYSWSGRPEDRSRDGYTQLGVEPNQVVHPPNLVTLLLKDERTVASTCSLLVRKAVVDSVGGWDESFREAYQDVLFLAKVYFEAPVLVADRCWDYYRQHGANSSARTLRSGEWHPTRPNRATERYLNAMAKMVADRRISDSELLGALEMALRPYRQPMERSVRQQLEDICVDVGLTLARGEDPLTASLPPGSLHDQQLTGEMVATWIYDAGSVASADARSVWRGLWVRFEAAIGNVLRMLERAADVPGLERESRRILDRMVHCSWWLRCAEGCRATLEFPENPDALRISIAESPGGLPSDVQLNQPGLPVRAGGRYRATFLARADATRALGVGCAQAHEPWQNLGLYEVVELATDWQAFDAEFTATGDDDNARLHFDAGDSAASVEVSSVTLRSISEGRTIEPVVPDVALPGREGVEAFGGGTTIGVGMVRFGSLRRTSPISNEWGVDRGRPIDRYYIEAFLASHRADIRGRVLEVADNTYTRQFGGASVERSDVLHVDPNHPGATVIADLTEATDVPSDSFDCIICTQTLQFIYDVRAAAKTLVRLLKPGGVLLATFPGISQTYEKDWDAPWYWQFTPDSARRLFEEHLPADQLQVSTFGNVLAAVSFLHGLACEELKADELDRQGAGYEMLIGLRVKKLDTVSTAASLSFPRASARRRFGCATASGALILMYHRVAEGAADPWHLAVSPDRFSEQMEILSLHAQPMSLKELLPYLELGRFPERAVVVTFDDGYLDNLHAAKPRLERAGVPATVFVTTGYLSGDREFWSDELEGIILEPGVLPRRLQLTVSGTSHEWDLGDAAHYSLAEWARYRRWSAASETPPTRRQTLYLELWRLLQPLPWAAQLLALEELREWAGLERHVREARRTLTPAELLELGAGTLIDIGAHTVTHPVLPVMPAAVQLEELLQSRIALERILGKPVRTLAYPYGANSMETVPLAAEAGFTCACTTREGLTRRGVGRYQLPRVYMPDISGEEFHRRLDVWFSA